jgi:hypothetical protein
MSDYVDKVLTDFVAEYEGKSIDLTGAYGPQSPDLIAAYISNLIGRRWTFEYPYAVDLWEDINRTMRPEFKRVTAWQTKRGDIGVFKQANGIGTVGILGDVVPDKSWKLTVFTQNPGPAGVISLGAEDLLGAWRLTEGAECAALATEYARGLPITQPFGAPPAEPRSFLARLADSVRGK